MRAHHGILSAMAGCAAMLGVASAHPVPKTAAPKPNEVLSASPKEIRIGFSEAVVAMFSGIELDDAAGKQKPVGAVSIDPGNARELIVPVTATLPPGTYTVKWHAVGDDTHHVSGHYTFQVK